ncbi:hypothetical protein [Sciscionella marina]|uniref:hypothetical protein n=1 Tax=Sciscionella marina TaxID=508770 RepID=UPI00036F091C
MQSPTPTVLSEPRWHKRMLAHRRRMDALLEPHRRRRAASQRHPVYDFLFTYYSHRPSKLARWHPGHGVLLSGTGTDEFLAHKEYRAFTEGVALDPEACTGSRLHTVEFYRALLAATASRRARLNCFGLHEWAMVYRQDPDQVRHADYPLRLGGAGTDAVLESQQVRCGHYDAFRFFTEPARPRNTLTPTRERQIELEQPGCLHANMDLYKAAYKLDPFIPAELVADCFELAADIRELDMCASPYDLSALGYEPVRIETPQGRAEYAARQAEFADRAEPLRAELVRQCDSILDWAAS